MQVAAGCCDRRQTTSKIRSFSPIVRGLLATGTLTALLLAGCGSTTRILASADAAGSLSGSVHSAGQPVGNAQVQLYAAGDATGTANPPLLKQPVITDSTGVFKVLETYPCPSPAAQLYLVATGGSVTAHAASSNNASTLIAALGSCDDLSASAAVEANELTTAAAVAALAPFMPSVSTLGAPATEQQALRDAFVTAADLAETLQQVNADPTLPPSQLASIQKLATLANILAACTATPGGSPGDSTPCGTLFSYTQSAHDTASALLAILTNPTRNVAAIFALSPASATFHPALASAPEDWSIALGAAPPQPTASPEPGTYTHPQTITLTDASPGARIFYSMDGVWRPYTTPFVLPTTKTLQTMALSSMVSHTAVASYAITAPKLVFLTQPASTSAGSILSPPPSVAVEDSTGAIVTSANYPVTIALSPNSLGAVLGGVTTTTTINGIATFPSLTIPTPAAGLSLTVSTGGASSATSNAFSNTGAINLIPMATTLTSGQSTSGFFTLSQPAPAGGTIVTLSSSDPTITSISPATQTVPQGQSSGNFTYKNLALGTVTLSGSASGFSTGNVQIATAGVAVSISPLNLTVKPGQSQQFIGGVTGSNNTAVTWSISPAVGSISASGLYTAPSTVATAQVVTVTATSVADTTRKATSTFALPASTLVTVSLTPGTANVVAGATQQFSSTVTGTTNTALTWSISPALGSITQYGLYTAPSTFVAGQVVSVVATSVADPSRSAYSPVTLVPAVGINVSPASATMAAAHSQQFTAAVTGSSNTGVTWSISPSIGSVSATGLYSTPATVSTGQVITITATSIADATRKASAPITLTNPVAVALSPGTATVVAGATQQFSTAVTGTTNTALTWSISPALGSITQYGLYTAPTSFVAGQVVSVVATSVADPTKSAYSPVTLTSATPAPVSSSG